MAVIEKLGLEDTYVDILQKARKGQHLSLEDLAERADLSVSEVIRVLDGSPETRLIQKLAFVLNLHGPSLVTLAQEQWAPQPVAPMAGLAMLTTPFSDMTVNAFLIWDPDTREAASFDTGSTCQPMLDCLRQNQLTLKRIFITHTHLDHLKDLDRLQDETQANSYGSAVENPLGLRPILPGNGFVLGNLTIRVLGTSGHTPGGVSYFIQGLARPVVIVGDALFAGSMGGAYHAYQEALRNNREQILTLPKETIICPGHGPLTTVGEERAHNPFFPELKA